MPPSVLKLSPVDVLVNAIVTVWRGDRFIAPEVEDIITYSTNVSNLIEGYSLESLGADKRTCYSVMKNIEVVGEAAEITGLAAEEIKAL